MKNAERLFGMTDDIAERVRKIGGTTIRASGHIARLQRVSDNDAEYVTPGDMLSELREDEKGQVMRTRSVHALRDDAGDVATASLLENWSINRSAASGSCLRQRENQNKPLSAERIREARNKTMRTDTRHT
jgi:DNA-binding ferritin-like protein